MVIGAIMGIQTSLSETLLYFHGTTNYINANYKLFRQIVMILYFAIHARFVVVGLQRWGVFSKLTQKSVFWAQFGPFQQRNDT